MNRIAKRKAHFLLASLASLAPLGACGLGSDSGTDPAVSYQNLLDKLGSGNSSALHAAAAVHTPRGLWNVYILSAPPDRVIFRQSRQDGEIEFGLAGDRIWRENMLTGQSRALEQEWRYFIRSYELFRLGSRLAKWRIHESQSACAKIHEGHRTGSDLCLVDEFGARVSIRIDSDDLPLLIVRELPEEFGGGVSRILPSVWTPQNGELLMTGFDQEHGSEVFKWDIQSIMYVPEGEYSIKPPAALR